MESAPESYVGRYWEVTGTCSGRNWDVTHIQSRHPRGILWISLCRLNKIPLLVKTQMSKAAWPLQSSSNPEKRGTGSRVIFTDES